MDLGLKDKVAVVTGTGSQVGFGHAIAVALAKEGCDVAGIDIDGGGAEKTAAEVKALGRKALAFKTDITNRAEVDAAVKKILEELSYSFWEDIQFKDFKAAAAYHELGIRDTIDIPYLLERLFFLKPEHLDIRNIEIQEVHIDSTGSRGRVKTKLLVNVLNTGKVKEPEVILYWYHKNKKWYMRLESSLRDIEKEKDKKVSGPSMY